MPAGAADILDTFTLNRTTGTAILGSDLTINSFTQLLTGAFGINSYSLTLNGTIDNNLSNTGTFSGDASYTGTSKLTVTGSGDFLGKLNFTSGAQTLQDFTLNRSGIGLATLGSNVNIGGTVLNTNSGTAALSAGALVLNGNTLGLNGFLSGAGTITGSAASSIVIGGNLNPSLGIINFTGGSGLLNSLTINRWDGIQVNNAATLGSDLVTNKLVLDYGVLSTGYNLLTIPSYAGAITANNIPWNTGTTSAPGTTTSFANSYIATCDSAGIPINVANPTTPLPGIYGFQINNIGTGSGDVYFPVGSSFIPAATGAAPTPNRVMLNSTGTPTNYNVVVNYGDIINTPMGRVNRVWYINATDTTAASRNVTMRLFYVDRPQGSNFPVDQNEIEGAPSIAFDYNNSMLVERDYASTDPNFIAFASGADVQHFPLGSYNMQEVYAQYSVGISPNVVGSKNGINLFNRFSISNPGGIILPLTVVNFTAYLKDENVLTGWTSLSEKNIQHYEIQRSTNGTDFITIGSKAALDNGLPSINYSFIDQNPLTGNNFYRIKIIADNGHVNYTSVQLVIVSNIAAGISIFPDPVTNNQFSLQMNNMPPGKYEMQIHNTLGQIILSKEINITGTSFSHQILLPAALAKGEYFIKIWNNELFTKKIIVE